LGESIKLRLFRASHSGRARSPGKRGFASSELHVDEIALMIKRTNTTFQLFVFYTVIPLREVSFLIPKKTKLVSSREFFSSHYLN
jgi:hypothetical protein